MSKRKLIAKLCYFDAETGEQVTPTEEEKQQTDSEFFKGFNEGAVFLAKQNLSKVAYRLILYMLARMAYQNVVTYNCKKIAGDLNLKTSSVSMALNELLELGFCVKVSGSAKQYLINPRYGFRGSNRTAARKWFSKLSLENFEKVEELGRKQKHAAKTAAKEKDSEKNSDSISEKINELKQFIHKSEKHGTNKRQELLNFLKKNVNSDKVVYKSVSDIVLETKTSKREVIEILKFLTELKFIERPKRGEIHISDELFNLF